MALSSQCLRRPGLALDGAGNSVLALAGDRVDRNDCVASSGLEAVVRLWRAGGDELQMTALQGAQAYSLRGYWT